jgi:hypothetical protein
MNTPPALGSASHLIENYPDEFLITLVETGGLTSQLNIRKVTQEMVSGRALNRWNPQSKLAMRVTQRLSQRSQSLAPCWIESNVRNSDEYIISILMPQR